MPVAIALYFGLAGLPQRHSRTSGPVGQWKRRGFATLRIFMSKPIRDEPTSGAVPSVLDLRHQTANCVSQSFVPTRAAGRATQAIRRHAMLISISFLQKYSYQHHPYSYRLQCQLEVMKGETSRANNSMNVSAVSIMADTTGKHIKPILLINVNAV